MSINTNTTVPVSLDALAVGRSNTNPFLTVFEMRNPTTNDVNYQLQQRWFNTMAETEYILTGFSVVGEVKTAVWQPINASQVAATETLTGNSGGPVAVDVNNNINVIGDGTSINIVGNPGTHTLTVSSINGQIMTGVIPDAHTAPGTTPVVPNSSGNITVTGAQVAAGTTTNVIRTDSLAANTYTIEIQRSQAVASSTIGDNGVSHFSNTQFTVDGNGFVQLKGGTSPAIQQIKNQVFNSNGTYTPTANMAYCSIQCYGGGGAGGGAPATAGVPSVSSGAGGGAGETAVGIFSAATIGASQAVTIGAAGVGVLGATGGNGGNTSVGALISAFGGSGGTSLAASTVATFAAGALGGTGGAGGDYRSPGQNGLWALTFGGGGGLAIGGHGGSSPVGAGGRMNNNTNGGAGLGFGAGGAGAEAASSSGPFTGGNGSAGIVIVTEYIA